MHKILAHEYLQLGGKAREAQLLLALIEVESKLKLGKGSITEELALQYGDLKALFQEIAQNCNHLNLPISKALIGTAVAAPPKTVGEVDLLLLAVVTELKNQLFMFIPPHRAKYYDLIFPSIVSTAFPQATQEMREAGNCLAAALYTACVFHSMRAAEIGVRALGKALGVSFPDKPLELAEWANVLDNAESKIRAIGRQPKSHERDRDQRFYSQAAAQFRYFKDGWRVRVAHARETFDEQQAIRSFTHTHEFFETLAERLKE